MEESREDGENGPEAENKRQLTNILANIANINHLPGA
jgi:hypothetical protein